MGKMCLVARRKDGYSAASTQNTLVGYIEAVGRSKLGGLYTLTGRRISCLSLLFLYSFS
jgi:hypothetical protein